MKRTDANKHYASLKASREKIYLRGKGSLWRMLFEHISDAQRRSKNLFSGIEAI